MQQRAESTSRLHHRYGRRTPVGRTLMLILEILAVAVIIVGLMNRPGGDFAPSVDMTPHTAAATSR